ncbi:MAG TPA: caspase domain-containing protein [Mesorhizobium sp.]|nr:caspase domain-containing protein [Mesorhizobium sp.]
MLALRSWAVVAAALLWLLLGASQAAKGALKGVALVIGQSDYEHLSALPNPANDARALDRLLTDLGFDVTAVTDADAKKLKRGLRRFAEDAEGADVALVYYSGHGIEAGGENFLVPVDGSVASLADAGQSLVPVGEFLRELQSLVPVSILLLDACRSNPFPPGSTLTLEGEAEPLPVSAAGLGAPRGATALSAPADGAGGLGAVIGYAAAPGHVALDGDPGGNSPYAAALLKHLSAGGFPFGDVMTMVAEEVYLKTAARQAPWTNSSLRRELEFGAAVEENEEATLIRGERRKLLLTISKLGEADRRQVAAAAKTQGVPMDALFAMLKAVGADAPQDPEALASLLDAQAERLKTILAERDALKNADPEIAKLAALAGEAVQEGALQAAIGFHEKAKARVASLSANVDDVEAQLKAKRLEFAAVFAESAETYALAFDHARAAEDFSRAFAEAERWDEALALTYKIGEAEALTDLAFYKGDATDRSLAAWRAAEALADPAAERERWADVRIGLANALWTTGERRAGGDELEQAAAILRELLAGELSAARRSEASADLGLVLYTLGARESGADRLTEAVDVVRAALTPELRKQNPLLWARLQNRLGVGLLTLGWREPGTERLEDAEAAFRAALEERRRETVPLEWAGSINNLAMTLATLGEREAGTERLEESVRLYRAALDVQSRERAPLLWAEAQSSLGTSLYVLGERRSGTAEFEEAAAAFRLALEEITVERAPLRWAALQENLGLALGDIGERKKDESILRASVAALELALGGRARDAVPVEWANAQNSLGNAYVRLGDEASLERAATAFRLSLEEFRRDVLPLDWAKAQNNLGNALFGLGKARRDLKLLQEAATAFRLALAETRREDDPLSWGRLQHNLGETLIAAGPLARDRGMLAEARVAIEAARDVFLGAGQTQLTDYFALLGQEIELAELEILVAEQLEAARKREAAE